LLAIDATLDGWKALWRVPLGAAPAALAVGPAHVGLALGGEAHERWVYDLPGPRLRVREAFPQPRPLDVQHRVAVGRALTASLICGDGATRLLLAGTCHDVHTLRYADAVLYPPILSDDETLVAAPFFADRRGAVHLFHVLEGRSKPIAELTFDEGEPSSVRFCGHALAITTTRGHALVLDTLTGAALRRF
jgi:hypothetical protein